MCLVYPRLDVLRRWIVPCPSSGVDQAAADRAFVELRPESKKQPFHKCGGIKCGAMNVQTSKRHDSRSTRYGYHLLFYRWDTARNSKGKYNPTILQPTTSACVLRVKLEKQCYTQEIYSFAFSGAHRMMKAEKPPPLCGSQQRSKYHECSANFPHQGHLNVGGKGRSLCSPSFPRARQSLYHSTLYTHKHTNRSVRTPVLRPRGLPGGESIDRSMCAAKLRATN